MERWRYGDFCSQDHKDYFTDETQRLVQERLMSLRRPEPSSLSTNTLFVDSPAVPAPQEDPAEFKELEAAAKTPAAPVADPKPMPGPATAQDPDPDIQEFVTQSVVAPLPIRRPPAAAEAPPAKPGRKDWKYLAKVADFDLLPVGINTGLSRLFRLMEVETDWASEEFSVPAARLVFVPEPFQPEDRRAKARMPDAELRPREAYQHESWASAPPPVTIPRHTWVDESGRRWVYSEVISAPGDYPGIAEVLEDYPLSAPWTDWPEWMFKGEPSWAPPSSARRASAQPGSQSAPPVESPGCGDGVPPPAAAQGFQLAPVAPAAPQARALGTPGSRTVGSGASGSAGAGQTSGAGVAGSQPGARSSAGRGYGGQTGNSRWQPIVPPLFHALVDIAHEMNAVPMPPVVRVFALTALQGSHAARPLRPVALLTLETRMDLREPTQFRLTAANPLCSVVEVRSNVIAAAPWSQVGVALPRLRFRVRKPGLPALPRHVSLRLPLLDRWNTQPSDPAMFLGASHRW